MFFYWEKKRIMARPGEGAWSPRLSAEPPAAKDLSGVRRKIAGLVEVGDEVSLDALVRRYPPPGGDPEGGAEGVPAEPPQRPSGGPQAGGMTLPMPVDPEPDPKPLVAEPYFPGMLDQWNAYTDYIRRELKKIEREIRFPCPFCPEESNCHPPNDMTFSRVHGLMCDDCYEEMGGYDEGGSCQSVIDPARVILELCDKFDKANAMIEKLQKVEAE